MGTTAHNVFGLTCILRLNYFPPSLLLCFIDPRVRKIGNEASSCHGQTHKPRAYQRQRHRPRTCQSMVNTLQNDGLARITGLSGSHSTTHPQPPNGVPPCLVWRSSPELSALIAATNFFCPFFQYTKKWALPRDVLDVTKWHFVQKCIFPGTQKADLKQCLNWRASLVQIPQTSPNVRARWVAKTAARFYHSKFETNPPWLTPSIQ